MRPITRQALITAVCLAFAPAISYAQIDASATTGAGVIAQLEAAQRDLAVRAAKLPKSGLDATGKDLGDITESLRKVLGDDAAKPIDKLGDRAKGQALRGYAAAQQTQAYLTAASGCSEGDADAMAAALIATVAHIAQAPSTSKSAQPAIYTQDAADHRLLFAVRSDSKDVSFALNGVNLNDTHCEDPLVTATDEKGAPLATQPTITSVLPNRIELKLPNGMAAGSYLLHVVPKKRSTLLICSTQPEATAAIQILPPVHVTVDYTVTATCRGQSAQPGVTGVLPDITAYGAAVSKTVEFATCNDPVSYTINAKATYADGSTSAIGPISQSAAADITAGLPGGLSFRWDAMARTIFVRASQSSCRGIY